MNELRDPDDAAAFLRQGLLLARLASPGADDLKLAALVLSEGVAIPPAGLIADVHAYLTGDTAAFRPLLEISNIPLPLLKQYEHHVLGRLVADPLLDRASAALRRYAPEDRLRGTAFVLRRLCERLALPGAMLSTSVVRQVIDEPVGDVESPALLDMLPPLVAAFRRASDLLGPEDVLALEQRTALGDLAQYVAHRQLLQVAASFAAQVQPRRTSPREVPTRFVEDDHYPVGGYSSIGTRGSMESLLHSQLAYMDDAEKPDLFDLKYVRDELFYYTRDENQFRRRRRGFGIHFDGSLTGARVKDPDAPAQRLVMAQAVVLALIQKLASVLADDALQFRVTFDEALDAEQELMAIVLLDERRRGIVTVTSTNDPRVEWQEMDRIMQFRELRVTTAMANAQAFVVDEVVEWPGRLQALLNDLMESRL